MLLLLLFCFVGLAVACCQEGKPRLVIPTSTIPVRFLPSMMDLGERAEEGAECLRGERGGGVEGALEEEEEEVGEGVEEIVICKGLDST
jgi:hypothetical protein